MSAPLPPDTDYFGHRIPFLALIGLAPVSIAPGVVEATLPDRPELCNATGHVHGGMIMSGLDFVMSAAARSSDPEGVLVSTVDMNTTFLLPARGALKLQARCLRQGKMLAFCEAEARDAEGRVVARATATFSVRAKG